jgi:large subunit ribosomal protein L4
MASIDLLNQQGASVEKLTLNDAVFGIVPNAQAILDVVTAQRAAMRQGTQKAKTRAEVRGGGRKPWRQKGTGRARVGSNRSPLWNGGGVVFAPSPRSYAKKVNRKVRRLALRSVLSQRVADSQLKVIDSISFDAPKTKSMVEVLNALNLGKKVCFVFKDYNDVVDLASRNIPGVYVTTASHASVYELMNYPTLVLSKDAVAHYEEVLG